jgi:hypothetical protein
MSTESGTPDAYDIVLRDLLAKKEQIDQAIKALQELRGGGAMTAGAGTSDSPNTAINDPGAFLGMTIPDAAKKLLAAKRKTMRNPDIAAEFKRGGLHLNSKDPINTIGAVLTRRAKEVGDLVKVGRGEWGLREWYPGRSFKQKAQDEEPSSSPTEPEQPSEQSASALFG